MWRAKGDPTEHPAGTCEATFRAETKDGQPHELRLVTEHAQSVYENEQYFAIVLGRLRPYGQDYSLTHPAAWIAEEIERNPINFYGAIAGFFAIVLLDKDKGTIRLISDHVGSVPLYYMADGEEWWVSDSLKLLEPFLRKTEHKVDPQALFNYCFFHCIPSPQAVYQGAAKLRPGEAIDIDLSGQTNRQNLYRPSYDYSKDAPDVLMATCRQVISDAVRRNITPRSGAFLSGGLDSSTVAGFFAHHQPAAPTFSIGFEADGYDETAYARITAEHFGTEHHEHYLQPAEIVKNFVDVAGFFDEPFGNSSALAAYVCAQFVRSHGVEVMLAGDGGDEIFGGNERYAKQKMFELWGVLPSLLRRPLAALLQTPAGELPGLRKARSYVQQASVPLPDRMDTWNFLNRFAAEDVFDASFLDQVDTAIPAREKRKRYEECLTDDPVERMMFLDWKFTLADNDLVKVTRMCRKAGVEVRYPLFEKEVVDFSCTVPVQLKLPGGKLRDFYKRSFRGFLPEETLQKQKHGFGLPFGVWMKDEPALQQLTHATLEKLKPRRIFREDFIESAVAKHQSGHSGYYGELIWIMVVLELWMESRNL